MDQLDLYETTNLPPHHHSMQAAFCLECQRAASVGLLDKLQSLQLLIDLL
jgi:hypothetical protein